MNSNKRPRGKESTEVRITQNKGKESENSYQKLKRSRWTGTRTCTRKQNQNISNKKYSQTMLANTQQFTKHYNYC